MESNDDRRVLILAIFFTVLVANAMIHVFFGIIAKGQIKKEAIGFFKALSIVVGSLPQLLAIAPLVHLSIFKGMVMGRSKRQLAAILVGAEGMAMSDAFKRSAELMRVVPRRAARFYWLIFAAGLLGLAWFTSDANEGTVTVFLVLTAALATFTAAYCASLYLEARMILGETPTPDARPVQPAK